MESCPRKEVENFTEKLVEENFYLITEVLLLGLLRSIELDIMPIYYTVHCFCV
jgi:hypothetical protein